MEEGWYLWEPEKLEIGANDELVWGFQVKVGEWVVSGDCLFLCRRPSRVGAREQRQRLDNSHE